MVAEAEGAVQMVRSTRLASARVPVVPGSPEGQATSAWVRVAAALVVAAAPVVAAASVLARESAGRLSDPE